MTPEAFVAKWSETTTKERASAQSHFNDLCALLGEPTPHEADPHGEWYAFEKGVEKTGAGNGWADVWKRGCFGWEYKSKSGGRERTMAAALAQLQLYALALESPPLLIVSDIDTIEIHTAFQNAVQEVHVIKLEALKDHESRRMLKWAFTEPERLKPKRTRNQITQEAASKFAQLAFELRADGHDPQAVAHFLNKILFCMFAEDAGILRNGLFTEVSEAGIKHPNQFDTVIRRLFQVMATGGPFGTEVVEWFNGGLFDNDASLPLTLAQIHIVRDMALMDWSQIEPAIFGTLFERGLDPEKRSQLGAHYTDPGSIMRLVNPTMVEPLLAEWAEIKPKIAHEMEQLERVKTKRATEKRRKAAQDLLNAFLGKLRNFRVLDPACGSGNFLYLALHALKNIEHRVNVEAEALGLARQLPQVGPQNVLGIEINSYAAELARVTIWIGEIQWMLNHGYAYRTDPILKPLHNIEERDAIITANGSEPDWPAADVIVGNPPFLGDRKMIRELSEDYVTKLRCLYQGRVPGGADLVVYWHRKSLEQMLNGKVKLVGLVATNSIRGGANRRVLEQIAKDATMFNAWSDEPWINEGAAVRVSLICSSKEHAGPRVLDGREVQEILPDLSSVRLGDLDSVDLTKARPLSTNLGIAFVGIQRNGPFVIDGDYARQLAKLPNPNNKSNTDVLTKTSAAVDITGRERDRWLIDFGLEKDSQVAALYELPFEFVKTHVKPTRVGLRRKWHSTYWWLFGDPRPAMRRRIERLTRYIATPQISKHRIFVWIPKCVLIENANIAITRDDDVTFGLLHSRFHRVWSLKLGTSLEDRPRYTNSTTFETFPFPDGLTPDLKPDSFSNSHADAISEAANELNEFRENWLNPPALTKAVPEVIPGYPDRILPVDDEAAALLKKRTLTDLYNKPPTWLQNAHRKLDEAVAAAYGWEPDLSDDEILRRLLELNLSRSKS
jgi:type II restriction/modification system DNA methylase subunit YeeA